VSYLPHTDAERKTMLEAIGVANLEELFADVPARVRFPALDLPAPISELELARVARDIAAANTDLDDCACFLGAGAYRHFRPATVDYVLRRGEFYTSYTPYQPEASQGMLQAMFEYQSLICRLTAMEVSNASHYDGATALAEAVLLALDSTKGDRTKVVISPCVHPQYRAVLRTYLHGSEATVTGDERLENGVAELEAMLDARTAALVIQDPNFFGQFEDVEGLAEAVHAAGALLIVIADPIALGLFRPPGEYGADVAVAEGQPLGLPLSYGGPRLGIFASRKAYLRRMSGRIVGETVDTEGRRGYVLTLGTREQHIRREKATSNICTNAALMALGAAVYLATLGKSGMAQVARLCYQKSRYAAGRICEVTGLPINPHAPRRPYFREFVVRLGRPVAEVNRVLLEEHRILGGYDLGQDYPSLRDHMLVAVTEMNTREEIDRLARALKAACR
jgi:glycine dehydrogenase subunit 1